MSTTWGLRRVMLCTGSSKVESQNHQASDIVEGRNTEKVYSTARSTPPAPDVEIRFAHMANPPNDDKWWYVAKWTTWVNVPTSTAVSYEDQLWGTLGHKTTYVMRVDDQWGNNVPASLPVNEEFDNPPTSLYAGEDWPGKQEGEAVSTAGQNGFMGFKDNYGVHGPHWNPPVVWPTHQDANVAVQKTRQYYRGGSTAEGHGVKMQSHWVKDYRGYARQE